MRGWRQAPFTLLWGAGRALELAGRASIHLAAGTLRLHDLRSAIANVWEEFGRGETAILSGLMPWESVLYDRFLKPEDRILVVGCGTGRDLIALLKLGYRVEGLDVAPGAIALARQMLEREGLSAELYTVPIEAVALPGSFDAFIFSWFCYSYIPQAETRIAVLRKAKAHLNPGGRILVSYIPAEGPPRALPIRLAQLVGRLTGSDWRVELGDVVGATNGGRPRIHYEHQFQDGEFENEVRAAGLTVVLHERRDEGTAVLMV
jgi:2-polyprenyl-3-methyl-5-hydroxy-6-metoxy-1,4-benzoquinol methylase